MGEFISGTRALGFVGKAHASDVRTVFGPLGRARDLIEELKSTAEQLSQFLLVGTGSGVPHYRQLDSSNYSSRLAILFWLVFILFGHSD